MISTKLLLINGFYDATLHVWDSATSILALNPLIHQSLERELLSAREIWLILWYQLFDKRTKCVWLYI